MKTFLLVHLFNLKTENQPEKLQALRVDLKQGGAVIEDKMLWSTHTIFRSDRESSAILPVLFNSLKKEVWVLVERDPASSKPYVWPKELEKDLNIQQPIDFSTFHRQVREVAEKLGLLTD